MSLSALRAQDHYKAVSRELEAAGLHWREEIGGRHARLIISVNGKEEVETLSISPSDHRAPVKARASIRRRIKQWKAEAATFEGSAAPAQIPTLEKETMDQSHMLMATSSDTLRMDSREIAELSGKKHQHVLRDIRAYVGAILQAERGVDVKSLDWNGVEGMKVFGHTPIGGVTCTLEVNDQNGQQYPIYHLDKSATITVVSGYNVLLRKRIVDRWLELEGGSTHNSLEVAMLDILASMEKRMGSMEVALSGLSGTLLTSEEWGEREKKALIMFGDSLVKSLAKYGLGLSKDALDAIGNTAGGAAKQVLFNKSNWEGLGIRPMPFGDEYQMASADELLRLIINEDDAHPSLTSWVSKMLCRQARAEGWPVQDSEKRSRSQRTVLLFPLVPGREFVLDKDIRASILAKNAEHKRGPVKYPVSVDLFSVKP